MKLEPVSPPSLTETIHQLIDPKKPAKLRAKIFAQMVVNGMFELEQVETLMSEFLSAVEEAAPGVEALALKEKYEQALEELANGPPKPATFLGEAVINMPGPKPRLHVRTPDGQDHYPTLRDGLDVNQLTIGMTVFLDAKRALVLGASDELPQTGHEATFVRQFPDRRSVELLDRDQPFLATPAQALWETIEADQLQRGDRVLWCPRRMCAFSAVPSEQDRKYRFLDGSKVPDIQISRDIGRPHWILGWMLKRLHILLHRRDLLERFGLRPRFSVFLSGPSGTGKTLHIRAFLHEFHQMLTEHTGLDDIGSRVIRVKSSDLLSELFGRTDQNIDALFNDIYAIGTEEFDVDGIPQRLPLTVILEEAEGLSRRRGEWDGAIYDRVMGMLLQRLDDPTDDLSKVPLIWVSTSNRPELVDTAMWRRLAGMRAHFNRLDREGFHAVLSKKLSPNYPYHSMNGNSNQAERQQVINRVAGWMFSPNNDNGGLFELTLRDGTHLTKHPRDLLTGAVVEQGVANCIDQTVFAADDSGEADVGIDADTLIDSLDEVIRGIAENLTPQNAADYVDLPDHSQVATVRHLRNGRRPLLRMAR